MKGHNEQILVAPTRAYWTTKEVAERLGVEIDTVYSWAASDALPHLRVGREYRFPIEGVLEWERQRLVVNDGSCERPKVGRSATRRKGYKTYPFVPRPYAGPAKKKIAA